MQASQWDSQFSVISKTDQQSDGYLWNLAGAATVATPICQKDMDDCMFSQFLEIFLPLNSLKRVSIVFPRKLLPNLHRTKEPRRSRGSLSTEWLSFGHDQYSRRTSFHPRTYPTTWPYAKLYQYHVHRQCAFLTENRSVDPTQGLPYWFALWCLFFPMGLAKWRRGWLHCLAIWPSKSEFWWLLCLHQCLGLWLLCLQCLLGEDLVHLRNGTCVNLYNDEFSLKLNQRQTIKIWNCSIEYNYDAT